MTYVILKWRTRKKGDALPRTFSAISSAICPSDMPGIFLQTYPCRYYYCLLQLYLAKRNIPVVAVFPHSRILHRVE
jgi:hypothetical protein